MFAQIAINLYFCTPILSYGCVLVGGLSSAGSEHLPYKQRVGGSNPSAPTLFKSRLTHVNWLFL